MPIVLRLSGVAVLLVGWAWLGAGAARAAASGVWTTRTAQPVVSDVIIRGNRLVSTDWIRDQMKTGAGKEFVPSTLQEDIRALYKTGQFGSLYADKREDGPGRV